MFEGDVISISASTGPLSEGVEEDEMTEQKAVNRVVSLSRCPAVSVKHGNQVFKA